MSHYADKHLAFKVVISCNKVEIFEYKQPLHIPECIKDCVSSEAIKNVLNEIPFDLPEQFRQKRADNLIRCRRTVRELIWCNITEHTKLLTLTYRKTVLKKNVVQRDLQTFVQQMKRFGYALRYCYVLENQRERGLKEGNDGCIHVHLVIFNDEYIELDKLHRAWPHGRLEIKILNGLRYSTDSERVKDAGAYICKYINDDILQTYGSHCYRCSKGLERPKVFSWYAYGGLDKHNRPDYFLEKSERLHDFLENYVDVSWSKPGVIHFCDADGVLIEKDMQYYQGTTKGDVNKWIQTMTTSAV